MTQSDASELAYRVSEETGVRYVAKVSLGTWTIVPRAKAIAEAMRLTPRLLQDEYLHKSVESSIRV